MKKFKSILIALLLLFVFGSAANAVGNGICSTCHVKMPEMDVRLISEAMHHKAHPDLEKLGKDLKISEWTVNECLTCHGASNSRIAFKRILHKIHLTSKYFTPKYNGTCITCHVLKKDGEIAIRDVVSSAETISVPAETLKEAPFLGKQ